MIINYYITVNKDGFINMSFDEPVFNKTRGIWKLKNPYVNSIVYDISKQLVEQNGLSWQSDPEPISINIS